MNILDRYVLGAFLRNYLISMVVLVGLYILLDIVFNLDEFTRYRDTVGPWGIVAGMAGYYGPRSVVVYSQLAGIIPVMAAAFTLMRMSRFNELTALLAAGVPLLRVAMPVILAAMAINLILQPINQELIIPRLAELIARDRNAAIVDDAGGAAVRAMPDGAGGRFDAARFHKATDAEPAWVETLTFIERSDEGKVARMVAAARGDWDADQGLWRLVEAREVTDIIGLDPVLPQASPSPLREPGAASPTATQPGLRLTPSGRPIDTLKTTVSPEEIELFHSAASSVGIGGSYYDLLSTRQINELLQRPGQYATAGLLRARHLRLATHVMNVILLLLAVPLVLTRHPGQLKQAAGKTLLLIGSAMGIGFVCQLLAKDPPTEAMASSWPALMAWLPVFIFGPIAVVALDRFES